MTAKDVIKQNISESILSARAKLGLSQQDLSRQASILHRQITRYEHGEAIPDLMTLIKLAVALGLTLDEIVDVEGIKREIEI